MKNRFNLGFIIKGKLKDIPFVATYHPILQALNDIIKRNLNCLYAENEVKNLFSPGLMVSFPAAQKISSYLVRRKVYPLNVRLDYAFVAKNGVRFALMLLKRILLPKLLTVRPIRLIICLIGVQSV